MPEVTVTLPCKIGSKVYTLEKHDFPCRKCNYGESCEFNAYTCYRIDKTRICPEPVYNIKEHICRMFEVYEGENGETIVSKPGTWGFEGIECFSGIDGEVYYSKKSAKEAMLKLKNTQQKQVDREQG